MVSVQIFFKCAASRENIPCNMYSQQRLKSACAPETLHSWLSKMHPVKIQNRLHNVQSVLNLHWMHMSEGAFSEVATQMNTFYFDYNNEHFCKNPKLSQCIPLYQLMAVTNFVNRGMLILTALGVCLSL